jgi:hypothetical protein
MTNFAWRLLALLSPAGCVLGVPVYVHTAGRRR